VRAVTVFLGRRGRESWKVNTSGSVNGPWVIQKAYCNKYGGHDFDKPLPEHTKFPTRKSAEDVKKTLS
jgi:hypothetical protein